MDRKQIKYDFKNGIKKMKVEDVPLGLMPLSCFYNQRLKDIQSAIVRFTEAKLLIPLEWLEEYKDVYILMEKAERKEL
jgi:hypothetical protein